MFLEALELDDPSYAKSYVRRIRRVPDVQLARDRIRLRTFILIYDHDGGMFDLTHHHLVLAAIQYEHARRVKTPWNAKSPILAVTAAITVLGVAFVSLWIAKAFRTNAHRSSESRVGDDRP